VADEVGDAPSRSSEIDSRGIGRSAARATGFPDETPLWGEGGGGKGRPKAHRACTLRHYAYDESP